MKGRGIRKDHSKRQHILHIQENLGLGFWLFFKVGVYEYTNTHIYTCGKIINRNKS